MKAILLTRPAVMPRPMWFTHRIFRAITSVTLVIFSTTVCTPLIAAIQAQNIQQSHIASFSADRQLMDLIDEVRISVGPNATDAAKRAFDPDRALKRFSQLSDQVRQSIEAQQKTADEKTIKTFNEQLQLFNERARTFHTYLVNLAVSTSLSQTLGFEKNAVDATQGNALSAWLDKVDPLPTPEDLTEMPFQALKPNRKNVPKDFSAQEAQNKTLNLTPKNTSFTDTQYTASKGEAELTTDIRAKANELNRNALNIYNWVRNNVEWQPTWGGQQTADMTLDVKKGNAMDIATLTIALLRASSIPARYAYGSVDIPAERFKNMAGDFESLDAAWDFVSAGGIPSTAVTSGGQITKMRIEHVWVEVALPYYPSKGTKAVSARNPIDTWVPIDPSSKIYTYLSGLDTEAIVNLDGEQIGNDFIASGTVNEAEGWVQGLNSNIIEQAQQNAQQKLEAHINGMQNPTVGDVIGGRTINQQTFTFFPSSLPYPKFTRAASYSELPDSLRTRVTLGLGWDRIDQSYQTSKIYPLYQLNQKNLTISFKPATTADETALKALVESSGNQPLEFIPSSISVIPEIKRDSETLITGSTLMLGAEVAMGYNFQTPTQNYLNRQDSVIAGSYLALGIVGSNPSPFVLKEIKNQLATTQETLKSGNESTILKLTREQLLGKTFSAGIYDYYVQYVAQSMVMGIKANVSFQAMPTAGTYGYEPHQRTTFGINRGIEKHGVYMNVRTAQALQSSNASTNKNIQFMKEVGMLSSILEHMIPESMFINESEIAIEGFSSAKALSLANKEHQKIYTINAKNNANAVDQLMLDSLTMAEIREALATGKEVITHTNQISVNGFKGSGYIILDPETGAGAYKISGGKNGSYAAVAASYRLDHGLNAWWEIRGDRTINEQAGTYSEVVRNAEHFLHAYTQICDEGKSRPEVVIRVYTYFIAKAIIWDINFIFQGPITIPYVGTLDFRGSPVTWGQLVAGLSGAALGSECGLD